MLRATSREPPSWVAPGRQPRATQATFRGRPLHQPVLLGLSWGFNHDDGYGGGIPKQLNEKQIVAFATVHDFMLRVKEKRWDEVPLILLQISESLETCI